MRYLLSICFATLLGAGCSDKAPIPPPVPTSVHLIIRYDDPVGFFDEMQFEPSQPIGPVSYKDVMWAIVSSHKKPADGSREEFITAESDWRRFDSLATAHGDTHWNGQPQFFVYMFRVTTGLHAVCDKDFDAAHPAGAAMDDLLTVHYYCLDEILVNGQYLRPERSEEQIAKNYAPYEYEMPLSKFNTFRPKLLAPEFVVRLTKAPTKTDVYQFTFTYTSEDGKKLVAEGYPWTLQGEK